jgi:hypothetical protein
MLGVLIVAVAMTQIELADYPTLPGYIPGRAVGDRTPHNSAASAEIKADRVPDTTDAVAWAVQDLMLRRASDRPFLRYLWVPPWGDVAWHQVNSLLVNSAASQASTIVLPEGVAGGWLIVWDLRRLAPKEADLKRLAQVWDALAHGERYFHVELDRPRPCDSYVFIDGQTYHGRRFVPAPHVEAGYGVLELETHSFAPLVRADDFLRRVSSTIDGGLYYHFIGFIRDGKRLNQAEIFKSVGLDLDLARSVEGDDRAAIFQSGVTAKPRTAEQVQGAIGKARITYDLFDEDVDASRHPIYELLDFVNRSRGKEIIFERSNGLFAYLITDGEGKLADVAPPNLVADHRTPEPVTRQLYPPLSCIRCHGPDAGVKPVRNDVPTLLAGGKDGDVELFDDLKSKDNRFATLDRLAGLYAAADPFTHELDLSRSRYSDAVWRATKGMGVNGGERVAQKAAATLSQHYADYWYPRSLTESNVNADRAALELGYRVEAGKGAALLRQLTRPQRADFFVGSSEGGGAPVESAEPSLAALRRGMTIRRQDFERAYAYAAQQVTNSRKGKRDD